MCAHLGSKFAAAALSLTLAGCHVQTSGLNTGNQELNAQATTAYTQLALRQNDALIAQMSSRVDRAELQAQLPFLHTIVPEGQPPVPTVRGNQTYTGTDARTYTVLQDYAHSDRTNHVTTRLIHENEAWKILSFNVQVTMKAEQQPVVAPTIAPNAT